MMLRFVLGEALSPIAHASGNPKEFSPEGAMPWTPIEPAN
jgi:hypothetical protein